MNTVKKILIATPIFLSCVYAAFAKTVPAIALQNGTALWTQKSEGMMEWAKIDLDAGTELNLYEESEKESSWTNAKNGQTLIFAKVNYQKKDYYVIANRVSANEKAAIVIKDCASYVSSNPADVRKKALSTGTVVSVGKKLNDKLGLIELSYYDESVYRIRKGYIKESKISTNRDDIDALKILKQALEAKDQNRRNALVQSISHLKTSDAVQNLIDERLSAQEESNDFLSEGTLPCVEAPEERIVFTADGSKVNVRDIPGSQANGNVVAQLENGTSILCDSYTVKQETIEGITSYWYQISFTDKEGTEQKGWIFGGFTKKSPNEQL